MFTRAIVRAPAPNFADGLTTAGLGVPDYALALEQHEAYCDPLERCGLTLTSLEPDPNFPDSTFVEDVAVLSENFAVLTRPGALSRLGEIESMRAVLNKFFPLIHQIESPGTLDGGDICQAGDNFFIGISERTNEEGARQLAGFLSNAGYTSTLVDLQREGVLKAANLLHLKSGLAYLGDSRLAVAGALRGRKEFAGYEHIEVHSDEQYAANCVRVNDQILMAAGYPRFEDDLRQLGYQTISLDMSEFQKMDGGLSCLSLRF